MSNFEFLMQEKEYELFVAACVEAEKVLISTPAMSAVGARKTLDLAVKWVHSAYTSIAMTYKDNVQGKCDKHFLFLCKKGENRWI